MFLLKILALIFSTSLIWKLAYSSFSWVVRVALIILTVVAVRTFVLQ